MMAESVPSAPRTMIPGQPMNGGLPMDGKPRQNQAYLSATLAERTRVRVGSTDGTPVGPRKVRRNDRTTSTQDSYNPSGNAQASGGVTP
jgi:hypothetical protein